MSPSYLPARVNGVARVSKVCNRAERHRQSRCRSVRGPTPPRFDLGVVETSVPGRWPETLPDRRQQSI